MVDYSQLEYAPSGELSELATILNTDWPEPKPLTEKRRQLLIEMATSGRYFGRDETLGGKRRLYTDEQIQTRRDRIFSLP